MKFLTWFLLLGSLAAQDQARVFDKKFVAVSAFTISATIADSYTTSWESANRAAQWNVHHPYGYAGIPCSAEGGEAWLYGRVPSPARAYGVGVGKIAIAETAAILLKRSHSRFWSVPLLVIGTDSAIGALHNAATC